MKKLIDFLRAEGVVAYSLGDLTLSVMPREATVDDVLQPERGPIATEPKKKKDGLTEEEQVDLYGRPMS